MTVPTAERLGAEADLTGWLFHRDLLTLMPRRFHKRWSEA
jgi:hypothetical protein